MTGTAKAAEAGGLLLVARSAMFSGVAVALAGAAHTIAGGESPTPQLLVGAFVVLTQLVVLLVPRERGFLPVAALLVLTQLVLHFVFGAFHAHPSAAADHIVLSGHTVLSGHAVLSGGVWPMGWGHLVAVLGAAWWLQRGEAHACRLAHGVLCAVSPPLTALLALGEQQDVKAPSTSMRVSGERRARDDSRTPGTSVRRRGPPMGAVASTG